MNQKAMKKMWIAVGIVGGVSTVAAATAAVLNSRRIKMLRAYKRTEKILYRVGSALQTVSELM